MDLAAAKSQLNITPVDYSYRMPVEFFGKFDNDTGKRLTPRIGTMAQLKCLSDIFSFSVFKDGGRGICTRNYEQFKRDVNVSESTVRRALKNFKDKYITSERKGGYQFDIENNPLSGGHYKLEAWMTRPISHNGKIVEFSNDTQIVAAFFNSECNRAPLELSTREIAYRLDMSVPAVQKAINILTADYKNNPFVYRTEKGLNGHKKSKYVINRKLFRELNKSEEKRLKAIAKEQAKRGGAKGGQNKPATGLTKAIEREIAARNQYRIERATSVYARALTDEEFRASDAKLKSLAPKLAYAEHKNLPVLPDLQHEEHGLTERRKTALKRLGIDEREFSEEFHCKCIKCRDKLFLADGKICDCFPRGAPPETV